jgi:hypothetical protein
MDNQHPITPPPELVAQWADMLSHRSDHDVFAQAARWGADQELEACCEWFVRDWTDIETTNKLRAARRPKPLSLKEQALALVISNKPYLDDTAMDIIRQALEQLDG